MGAVERRAGAHNNAARIASSPALTSLKLAYYRALAAAYSASGAAADVVVANGESGAAPGLRCSERDLRPGLLPRLRQARGRRATSARSGAVRPGRGAVA